MGTYTLRPNSDYSIAGGGGWSVAGGGTFWDKIDDDPAVDTSSYVNGDNNFSTWAFTTAALPALSRVVSVTPRVRFDLGTTGPVVEYSLGVDGLGWLPTRTLSPSGSGWATYTGTPETTNQAGGAWTQANIDGLLMRLRHTTSTLRFSELYLDVVYNEAPVATVTGPSEGGSVTTTTRPTVTWTYSDPEADAQERFRVKIFSAAQYGIGGFDPETSPSTWDSGEVFSSSLSYDVPVDLVNGTTYRAYVKVADAGSGGRYGNWDSNTFTINVTAPPAPTLAVTAQPSNATGPRNKVDVTRAASATATTWMFIEKSDDAGATWSLLRGAEHIVNSPDGTTFTTYDYEAIPRVQRLYRAKAVRTV